VRYEGNRHLYGISGHFAFSETIQWQTLRKRRTLAILFVRHVLSMVEVFTFISFQRWLFQIVAMVVTAFTLPGLKITSIVGPVLAVVALAFVNTYVWSAALFFQFPDSLSLHAIVLLFANAVIFWLLIKVLPGIEINGVISALIAPIIFSVISVLIETYGVSVPWGELGSGLLEIISSVRDYLLQDQPLPIDS
jgi:putative membrane protein